MKASITQKGNFVGETRKFRKENHFYRSFTGFTADFKKPVEVRFYRVGGVNGSGPIYCCVWIESGITGETGRVYRTSGGVSGSWFAQTTAALLDALENMSVVVSGYDPDWTGENHIPEIILAVSAAFGFDIVHIHDAHG